jgi:IS1 family transposase
VNQPDWILACIYGDASYKENPNIWRALKDLNATNAPLCCIGDFNAIKDLREKWKGTQRLNQNNIRFRQFLFDTGLIDLGFKGPAYTMDE